MSLSLPFSPNRRYLTGIDWAVGTLDHITRQRTGAGNLSQIILELDGSLPIDELRNAMRLVSNRLPILFGRVGRDPLNLAPYWHISQRGGEIPLSVVELVDDENVDALFTRHVNTPLVGHHQHLRMLLAQMKDGQSRLGLVFDHRLLDAYGAESFLHLLELTAQGHLEDIAPQIEQTEPAHLDNWAQRFEAGRVVNAFFRELRKTPVLALPMPTNKPPLATRFVRGSLSFTDTEAFIARAADEAGIPALLPSALARAVCAVAELFRPAAQSGEQFVIAASVDRRAPDEKWRKLLFNHLSFMWFAAPTPLANHPRELAMTFRDQLFDQLRMEFPEALNSVTMLTRICPHWIASRLPGTPFVGRACSFYFACLRGSGFESDTFLGRRVLNLTHTPRIPPPPGLGMSLTFHAGRLHAVLSYLDGVVSKSAAAGTLKRMQMLLSQPI